MFDELFNYLKSFMIGNEWNYGNTARQAKAMFTTLCFVGNIDADTVRCDNILHELFREAEMRYVMSYSDFESFMIELIV